MTWLIITGMALGLPMGMLLQRRHERREAARRNRGAIVAAGVEVSRRWQSAQDELNKSLSQAWASAQSEARRCRIESAKRCGCADCVIILQTWGAN